MAQFVNIYDVDLMRPSAPRQLRQMVCEGDAKGNRVGANVYSDGSPVSLGGQCVGKVVRADGTTVPLTGTVSGNQAYVVLDQTSCAVEGPVQVAVCWVSGTNITTLVVAYGAVINTQTGTAVQPSTPIPDLTQLLAEIDAMRAATAAANAAAEDVVANFELSQIKLPPTWTDGKYVAGANVEITSQYYSIADFDVADIQGDVIISSYGEANVGWILLDANDAQIERSLFSGSTGSSYNFQRKVSIPQNGTTLRVSCTTTLKDHQNILYLVRDNDFLPCVANASTVFDSVRKFSAYSVEVSNLTVETNKVPYDNFHGTIITTGKLDASQQQLALSYDQRMFIRRKFNTWSAWKEVAIGTPTTTTTSTNFDDVTNPFFVCGVGGLTVTTNHVPYDGFNGCVYNINYGGDFSAQIAVANNAMFYYRYKYANWSDWHSVSTADRVERLENDYCILSEFDNIFCAGDSLTWGAVYTGSGSSDFRAAKKPYNAILQLRTGAAVARNAQPGIDAIAYVSKLSSITEKTNQLVIIYLGTNGGLTDTLDTDAPGMDKSQYDLTTETGSYAYIVKHCLDVNAKVLLVKIYAGGGSKGVSTTNTVIGKVAEKFGVAVIENESLPQKYHIWPNGQGYDYTHLNDFGYAAFAEYLIRQVNAMDATTLARILPDS